MSRNDECGELLQEPSQAAPTVLSSHLSGTNPTLSFAKALLKEALISVYKLLSLTFPS